MKTNFNLVKKNIDKFRPQLLNLRMKIKKK